jgi:hypothetical protein
LEEDVKPVSLVFYYRSICVVQFGAPAEFVQKVMKEKILFKGRVPFKDKRVNAIERDKISPGFVTLWIRRIVGSH